MGVLKDRLLNGLLAVLVITSVGLSAQVWFPSEVRLELPTSGEAQILPSPPVTARSAPETSRPERILVRRKDGNAALLPVGHTAHTHLWELAQTALRRMRPTLISAATSETQTEGPKENEWIVLYLPIALRLTDWADQWSWSALGPTNQSVLVDRVTFHLGKEPAVYLTGPSGGTYRVAAFSEIDQKQFQEFIEKQIDSREFFKPKQLAVKDLPARVLPDILVPDLKAMPDARVRAQKPLVETEKARFFPDLSVVRVIDEKDAKSFTDGQRLLRLSSAGILEFRTADAPGSALEFRRALSLATEWVSRNGGWSQDLVISSHAQEPGRTSLQFETRSLGPYPVESSGGAMQIDFTGDRVTYLRRFPDFTEIVFGRLQVPIMSPEEALKAAVEQSPLSFFEAVRDIHPAYRLRPGQRTSEPEWLLEPVWVVQVGATRIYVPAVKGMDLRSFSQVR